MSSSLPVLDSSSQAQGAAVTVTIGINGTNYTKGVLKVKERLSTVNELCSHILFAFDDFMIRSVIIQLRPHGIDGQLFFARQTVIENQRRHAQSHTFSSSQHQQVSRTHITRGLQSR